MSLEFILVLYDILKLYAGGVENRKSLTVVECVNAAREHLPAFVIAPSKKVIEN